MFAVSGSKSVRMLRQHAADKGTPQEAVLTIDHFEFVIDLTVAQIHSSVKAYVRVRCAAEQQYHQRTAQCQGGRPNIVGVVLPANAIKRSATLRKLAAGASRSNVGNSRWSLLENANLNKRVNFNGVRASKKLTEGIQ